MPREIAQVEREYGVHTRLQVKGLHFNFAFKRLKNFACVEAHPATPKLFVYVEVDPSTVELKPGFTRDVRNIGHYATGDLEIVIKTRDDFEMAKQYLIASYE